MIQFIVFECDMEPGIKLRLPRPGVPFNWTIKEITQLVEFFYKHNLEGRWYPEQEEECTEK